MVAAPAAVSPPQMTFPNASVVSLPLPVNVVQSNLPICNPPPPEIWMPDDVAVMPDTVRPVYIVDVEFAVLTKLPAPWMEKIDPGLVVPTPTLPLCMTFKSCPFAPMKRVEVATNALAVVVPVICAFPWTEAREPGG